MKDTTLNILLADDDLGDCLLFKEALAEVRLSTNLATMHDGAKLMAWLSENKESLSDVLFLDLNMPRMSGQECLMAMKKDEKLMGIPVVICTTSYMESVAEMLYNEGACYYIQKPVDFELFIILIQDAITFVEANLPDIKARNLKQPAKNNFYLNEPTWH